MNTLDLAYDLVKKAISQETKLEKNGLNVMVPFDEYGIESIMSVSITRILEETFGELSKSLLFEFPTIKDLAEFLESEYSSVLQSLITGDEPEPEAGSVATVSLRDTRETQAEIEATNTGAADLTVEVSPEAGHYSDRGDEPGFVPPIFKESKAEVHAQPIAAIPAADRQLDGNNEHRSTAVGDIAIIGMAGRFPEADDIEEFWRNLLEGKDCISTIPERLWDWREYWDERKGINGRSYLKWGGFLSDNRTFDHLFFGMSKLEAETMDPQERVFLETVHHTFEDAGYNRKKRENYRTGLYVGIMWGQYQLYGGMDATAGSSYASIANRASYFFDLRGPSIPLDTMCSGSMTTVHLACESIRNGEVDMAIAGGVNLTTHPNKYFVLSKTGFGASHGRCKSFSDEGDGYVPSEGVGAVLLKSLDAAIRDGDRIYGVIKASAINHGGRMNGFTVPSAQSQEELVTVSLDKSSIDPETISYVEAHAPGTALGDPIEVRALTSAFRKHTDATQYCSIGSVKSNIGHLESAASFASIVKVIKQMQEKTLVPSIHLEKVNTNINFEKSPFYLQKELAPWKTVIKKTADGLEELPRRAAINSFGAGGANAHMIVEEYIYDKKQLVTQKNADNLFVFSARNEQALNQVIENYHAYLCNVLDRRIEVESGEVVAQLKQAAHQVSGISEHLITSEELVANLLTDQAMYANMVEEVLSNCNVLISVDDIRSSTNLADLTKKVLKKVYYDYVPAGEDESRFMMSMAYTLQTGREHLTTRLSLKSAGLKELQEKLSMVIEGKAQEGVARGKLSNAQQAPENTTQDRQFISKLIDQGNIDRLAQLWCEGVDIDWQAFYYGKPSIVSLPLYPFAKSICWADSARPGNTASLEQEKETTGNTQMPKPDIDVSLQESLAGEGIVVRSRISYQGDGDNSDIKQGALLGEIFKVAEEINSKGTLEVRNMNSRVELSPGMELKLVCKKHEDAYSINAYTENSEVPVCAALYRAGDMFPEQTLVFDIDERHVDPGTTVVPSDFPWIDNIKQGKDAYMVHYVASSSVAPLTAALSTLFLAANKLDSDSDHANAIRFNKNILVMGEVPESGWVVVHRHDRRVCDAVIMDDAKGPVIYFQGIAYSSINREVDVEDYLFHPVYKQAVLRDDGAHHTTYERKSGDCLIVRPSSCDISVDEAVESAGYRNIYFINYGDKIDTELLGEREWNVAVGSPEDLGSCMSHLDSIERIIFFNGSFQNDETNSELTPVQEVTLFHQLVRHCIENDWNKSSVFQINVVSRGCEHVSKNERLSKYAGSISGYLRSLKREHRNIDITVLDTDWWESTGNRPELPEIFTDQRSVPGDERFLREGLFYQREIEPFSMDAVGVADGIKDRGVYVMIGGAGVVGNQLSQYLAENYHARLIWVNRSPLNEDRKAMMGHVTNLGGECDYYSADVGDRESIEAIFDAVEKKYDRIDGVFHLAMEREIARVSDIDANNFAQRVKSKISGTEVLAGVLSGRKLDFLILFSSTEAYVGSPGWSPYTAGCAYQSQSVYRLSQSGIPAYVINWGFWEGVDETVADMLANKGIRFLNINEGMEVIKRLLATEHHQVLALNVEDAVLKQMGFTTRDSTPDVEPKAKVSELPVRKQEKVDKAESVPVVQASSVSSDPQLTRELVQSSLISLFSRVLKIDESEIQPTEDMLNYGVDSLIVLNIQTELEEKAGQVSVNLLLENQTIADIADVMLEDYRDEARALVGAAPAVDDGGAVDSDAGDVKRTEGQESPMSEGESVSVDKAKNQIDSQSLRIMRNMSMQDATLFLNDYRSYFEGKTIKNDDDLEMPSDSDAAERVIHGVVQTSEGDMEVFVSGQGVPVVLMSAVALTAPTWLYLINSRLREKYRFIIVHPPGYGVSDPVKECNTAGISKAVMETLDALGIQRKFHLVGSCLGCAASMYMSKQHPERIASLTLVGGFHDTSDLNVGNPDKMSGAEFEKLAASAVESLNNDFQAVVDALKPSEQWMADTVRERRDLLLNSQCVNFLVALRYLNEMMNLSLLPWLHDIKVPTHCVYGDVDAIINPRHSQEISAGIEASQLTCIPGSGHFPYLTHEKLFNSILESFIDANEELYLGKADSKKLVSA